MAGYNNNYGRGRNTQEKGSNTNAASASNIGEPFNNPYTFIPFPDDINRYIPTALTADENTKEYTDENTGKQVSGGYRKSGILELDITTLSPLMSCSPTPYKEKMGHKYFNALTIKDDVIVPATGIRGALRTLMTIISGGTLGYMDEDLWLTQGRDAQLGPNNKIPDVPDLSFLAEVIRPGSGIQPGKIKLGETRLIKAEVLENVIRNLDRNRPTTGKKPLYVNDSQKPTSYSDTASEAHPWKVKLSGRPIMRRGKKEGLFNANGAEIPISEHFWKDYQGRNRHSFQKELRKGDLIWLEPIELNCKSIICENDIKSIQWARWGRQGVALKNIIPDVVIPDSMRNDGTVDMVTDLFGQVPHKNKKNAAAGPFAARIRPGNLVFKDAKNKITTETLAPLAAPHPGCIAFYRDQENLDMINSRSPLKGYKVYRNTIERGENAPWKYSVQGVYVEKGVLKFPAQQKVNKTVDLLNEGLTGTLRIAFRALAEDELALLFAACSVDWKLGGGKPLGLGHCRVTGLRMIDVDDEDGKITEPMGRSENGENLEITSEDFDLIDFIKERFGLYRASQITVKKLRYPRAVTKNNNKSSRAGLSWFARHASPRKSGQGLETIWTKGTLKSTVDNKSQIKAQALPKFSIGDSDADLLYGYDVVELEVDSSNRNQRTVGKMERFESSEHAGENEQAGDNTSPNSESRKEIRGERTSGTLNSPNAITKENIGTLITQEFDGKKITPDRAKELLDKLIQFGITKTSSNKWADKFSRLESICSK